MPASARFLATFATVTVVAAFALFDTARAQIPPPPAFIYGSISDAEGEVPEGVIVEAIVNNNVCGTTETVHTGEGDARVTVYALDVVADGQTSGCGTDGAPVRIRVGDRIASGAVPWETGYPIRKDIVFGNATPAPIPTFTPTPEGAPTAPPPTSAATATPAAAATQPSTDDTPATDDGTPPGTDDGTPGDDGNATSTLEGGLTDATAAVGGAAGGSSGNGGLPVWAVLLVVVGGIVAVGGGIGYLMSRPRQAEAGEVYSFDDEPAIGENYDTGSDGDRVG